jgi:hypothetical protein
MKSLKENGLAEIRQVRKRVIRSFALARIGKTDHDFLLQRCNEMEARIVAMPEYGEEDA